MYLVKVETIQFRSFVSGDFRRSESRIWNFRRSESEFAPVDALPWVDPFQAKYLTYLPTKEELAREIENQKAIFALQQGEKE